MNKATTQPQCINATLTMEEKYLLKYNYRLSNLRNIYDAPGNDYPREDQVKIVYPYDEDDDPSIIIIQISVTRKKPYPSITGEIHRIISVDEAEKETLKYLKDNDEHWKTAVEAGNTTTGLEEYNEELYEELGYNLLYDTSLYPDKHEINGKYYILNGHTSGCIHEQILKVTPPLKALIKNHLKKNLITIMQYKKVINQYKTQLPELEQQVQTAMEQQLKKYEIK